MDLESAWAPQLSAQALIAVRLFVVLRLQPQWGLLAGRGWWVISAALALLLAPAVAVAPLPASVSLGELAQLAILEAGVGLVLGTLVSLPGHALLGATTGAAGALRTAPRPFVAVAVALALVAGLGLGLHRIALTALVDHAHAYPPGRLEAWTSTATELLPRAIGALDGALVLALSLATPVLLTVVILRTGIALLGAGPPVAAPTTEVLSASVATLAALVALAASWAAYPHAWARAAIPPGS